MIIEHQHPLNLIDMFSKKIINYEEESDEDADENGDFITKQDFECKCYICGEEIIWYHRYYYKCDQCHYSIHKFCKELPKTVYYISDLAHTHTLSINPYFGFFKCDICETHFENGPLDHSYVCSECFIIAHIKCATKLLKTNIIHHPSHIHPLICSIRIFLCKCDACGKKHKGEFYQCVTCPIPMINKDCAFLPLKLQIQKTTLDLFFHPHPLTLTYSFPNDENHPSAFDFYCRVCDGSFDFTTLWIYKCDKCRFYVHLDCATYRGEPFMSILTAPGTEKLVKNYEDHEYPNLLHLPFPDESYSLLKHLFYKETNQVIQKQTHVSHQHPLILVDVTEPTTSLKVKKVSYHNPMKNIRVLCDGCLRPIMNPPFYMCANDDENCNFLLHEWCTRLPVEIIDHPGHPQHPLVYYPKIPYDFLGNFECSFCKLLCNGFVYCCVKCQYHVDVCCAFIPQKITHKAHPNHLLLRVENRPFEDDCFCRVCRYIIDCDEISFSCQVCDVHLHPMCALLHSEMITHKYDKHPMELNYFPIENHKGDYFCEVCEEDLDPNTSFYHCHECVQSIHTSCAPLPLIVQSETYLPFYHFDYTDHYKYVNMKFRRNQYMDMSTQEPYILDI